MSDTSGPAFPRTGVGNAGVSYDVPPQDGMTLRQWYAGMALQALPACSDHINADIGLGASGETLIRAIAVWSVRIADEMLGVLHDSEPAEPVNADLLEACEALLPIVADAIVHGMPITPTVADARNIAVAAIAKAQEPQQ